MAAFHSLLKRHHRIFFTSIAGTSSLVWTSCDKEPPGETEIPFYTADQVSERNGRQRPEAWVSYKGIVYDISSYLDEHPGGSMIRDAAGGPLEPYWGYWAYHHHIKQSLDALKPLAIGRLAVEDDMYENREDLRAESFAEDPDRTHYKAHGHVEVTRHPYCSETLPEKLRLPFTPNDAFYIRNHAPVPKLDAEDYSIDVTFGNSRKSLSLQSLSEKHHIVTIPSVMQCAGNRAQEMNRIAPTAFSGTPFERIQTGMLGHAAWTGVRLCDVLLELYPELQELPNPNEYHVVFEGVDQYSTSTPLFHILDPTSDGLLAWEMNGDPLSPDHGYPLRVVLPGVAGARNVKWVHKITIQKQECDSGFQRHYYLDHFGRSIQELPMQSIIVHKKHLSKGTWHVQGVCWGGGSGIGVSRVQVSLDGKSWTDATLTRLSPQDSRRHWSWVRFDAELNSKKGEPTVMCRAIDNAGNVQPERPWNARGYLYNGWHRF